MASLSLRTMDPAVTQSANDPGLSRSLSNGWNGGAKEITGKYLSHLNAPANKRMKSAQKDTL